MLLKPVKKVLTMKEIAVAADVSLATAYRILKNPEKALTERQKEVVSLLIQNSLLREIPGLSGLNIVYCIREKDYLHVPAIFLALQKECFKRGISITLAYENQLDEIIRITKAKGIIVGARLFSMKPDLPMVIVQNHYTTENYSSVCADDSGAMISLFGKLKSLGHQRIFYYIPKVYHVEEHLGSRFLQDDIRSFYIINGLDYDPALVYDKHDGLNEKTHYDVLTKAANYFLALPDRPTAVVLPSDVYAEVFYNAIRSAGLRIPNDVSIAAYDNIARYHSFLDMKERIFFNTCHLSPPLTTFDIPLDDIAFHAVDLLLRQMANPSARRMQIKLQSDFIETNSISKVERKNR